MLSIDNFMSEILLSRSLIHLEKIMRPDADSLKNHFLHIYVHGLAEMLVCVVEMQIYAPLQFYLVQTCKNAPYYVILPTTTLCCPVR